MKKVLTVLLLTVAFIACKKDKPKSAPTVTTSALTNITTTGATAGGTITSDGNVGITAAGIVLSRKNNMPTLTDTVLTSSVTTGSFTVIITNLEFGRTYYIRAYATNSIGTSYGDVVTLNTTSDDTKVRFTYNGQEVVYGVIVSPTTGRTWMDRNLGASRVATAYNDDQAYGDLFQWGRLADGHQLRTSDTTWTLSATDAPGHNKLIKVQGSPNNDWRNPQNDNLWQGSTGINNPCPAGWHVPTQAEWAAETSITDYNSGYNVLKTVIGGYRWIDTKLYSVGTTGYYWTSTVQVPLRSITANISSSGFSTSSGTNRGQAEAIRCIKD